VIVVVATTAALLLRAFVVAPYFIPSASMEPTLHGCSGCNNDRVLVNKLSYRIHSIHRGDVVVFHRPKTWQVSDKVLIKRVIGLPGEVLTTRKGIVYVDGLELAEPYLDRHCPSGTVGLPAKSVTVPPDTAFVMGDNRCDSSDSRRFGAIPESSVIGRAFVTIWPFGRMHWL
jgi:signal peptidase I